MSISGINNIERNRAIVKQYREGKKQVAIAQEFGISRQCVHKIIRKYNNAFDNPIYEKLLENNSTHIADREYNKYKKNPKLINELLKQEKQVATFPRKEKQQKKEINKLKLENKDTEKAVKELAKTRNEVKKAEHNTEIWEEVLNDYDLLTSAN